MRLRRRTEGGHRGDVSDRRPTLAVGHVNDPSSWLSLHIGGKVWIFDLELYAGLCLELIDLPEGASVEDTDAVAQEVARILLGMDEVRSVQTHRLPTVIWSLPGI